MSDEVLHQFLAVAPGACPIARRLMTAWLLEHAWPRGDAEDLVLAVNEAVANSAEHAYLDRRAGGGAGIELEARLLDTGELRRAVVIVTDQGRWRPPPEDSGSRGRGLRLMRALVDEVQVHGTATGTQVTMISTPVPPPDHARGVAGHDTVTDQRPAPF